MTRWSSEIGRFLRRHCFTLNGSGSLAGPQWRPSQATPSDRFFFSPGAGDGAGKGGGSDGAIRSSGGAMGRKSVAEGERDFEENDQLARLREHMKIINDERIAYHTNQINRELESIKEHEKLQKSDKDPSIREVYIKSHQEALRAHQQMLDTLNKEKL